MSCRKEGESVDHLLMHCEVASTLWNQLFNEAGFCWVAQENYNSLFVEDMIGFGSNKMARALWKSMILALM